MKISPFAEGKAGQMPDPERVNVWPLVYHNRDATSVLWPIVDWDDEGFAVRPLINKEGDDWSVLFPLSGWNTKDKEGWVLTGYHYDDNTGVFPLFNAGDEFCYVIPVWWTDDREYGVFPVMAMGGDFSYVIPVWWTDDGEHGVFPLYGWGDEIRHVGPVWWDKDGEEGGLFPLYDQDITEKRSVRRALFGVLARFRDDTDGDFSHWVFPCYYSKGDKDEVTRMLLPVFAYHKDGNDRLLLTPLGGRSWDASGTTNDQVLIVLPLFGYGKDGDDRILLTPLGGRGWNDAGETSMINVVGPVYHYHKRGEHTFHAALWPIFTMSDGKTWRLWPAVSYTGDKGRPGPLHDCVLVGITDTERRKGVSCFGPIVFDYDRRVHADGRPDWDADFLLVGRLWHQAYERDGVPHPRGNDWQSCVERQGRHLIVAHHSRETFRVWRDGVLDREEMQVLYRWWHNTPEAERAKSAGEVAEVLRKHGAEVADDDPETVRTALSAFVDANTELTETVEAGIPLVYRMERSGDDTEWKVLFGILNGKRTGERSRVSVLRYLYHRERDGNSVSRDFFPFVTWDSSPERGRFSFLWRVFSYERASDSKRGHFLFFPWGD